MEAREQNFQNYLLIDLNTKKRVNHYIVITAIKTLLYEEYAEFVINYKYVYRDNVLTFTLLNFVSDH